MKNNNVNIREAIGSALDVLNEHGYVEEDWLDRFNAVFANLSSWEGPGTTLEEAFMAATDDIDYDDELTAYVKKALNGTRKGATNTIRRWMPAVSFNR